MSYIGDFALGSTFDTKFCTVDSTGAPTTLSGTPSLAAYVDNNTTEITAGITLSVDFDSRTGLNSARVVATSGNGYASGGNYQLTVIAGTVGGVSVVGYVVAEFSIEARSALRPTTAARTLDVSAGGEAGLDWANIGSPTTAVNLSGTTVSTLTTNADKTSYSVAAIANNAISASAIATGAITAAKFAADAIDSAALATSAVNEIADGILNRDMSAGTDSGSDTFRTMRQALFFLRNKWVISGGTLTVYKVDDSTSSWTSTVGTDAAASPIVSNDPAGP